MSSVSELDLTGIVWPVCLLEFKRALLSLDSEGELEILTQDPDVVEHIKMIIERSEDMSLSKQTEGDTVRLSIFKRMTGIRHGN
ncbi:MAG: sulfurtransferase TusA family protein [Deltaproteobacteria bacterium]|nr:sulfurtransferase TusA family protein [Deltaproteobacteria bacterium]